MGQTGEEEEGRREEREGYAGCIVPGEVRRDKRGTQAAATGRFEPAGWAADSRWAIYLHLGGCGPLWLPRDQRIVGLARRGWEWCPRTESLSPSQGGSSRQATFEVAGESCGWSPAGGEKGAGGGKWKIRAGVFPRSLSVSAVRLEPKVGCVALP